jgi:hypothetical protein
MKLHLPFFYFILIIFIHKKKLNCFKLNDIFISLIKTKGKYLNSSFDDKFDDIRTLIFSVNNSLKI